MYMSIFDKSQELYLKFFYFFVILCVNYIFEHKLDVIKHVVNCF